MGLAHSDVSLPLWLVGIHLPAPIIYAPPVASGGKDIQRVISPHPNVHLQGVMMVCGEGSLDNTLRLGPCLLEVPLFSVFGSSSSCGDPIYKSVKLKVI